MPPVLVFGAGGHAKVVIDILRAEGRWVPVAMADDNPSLTGGSFSGLPVIGGMQSLPLAARDRGIAHVVVAIGRNDLRLRVAEALAARGLEVVGCIHPSAVISPSARIGAGTVVMPGACINADTVIGSLVIINTRASVDHDCVIADGAHVAPGVSLCGGVHIGRKVLVGVGAQALPGVVVGDGAVVGAGSTVTRPVPDHTVVAGSPARVFRSSL